MPTGSWCVHHCPTSGETRCDFLSISATSRVSHHVWNLWNGPLLWVDPQRRGNTYVREEDLSRRFADVITRIQISAKVADWIAGALRESQDDKQKFHRASVMRLQRQYLAVQAKIDRAYEDRLAGRVSDDLWERKTQQWEQELADIRRDTALHETASHDYAAKGSKILELAKNAHNLFVRQDRCEQARLLKTLVSNSTVDRGVFQSLTLSRSIYWLKGTKQEIGWVSGTEFATGC